MTLSFSACNSPSHEGLTNTWFTPKWMIDALGPFDLDPCTQTYRPFDTAIECWCEDRIDGLQAAWSGRVWLNPPYGRKTGEWLKKLAIHGNGVALVFARMETTWAAEAINDCHAVNFIRGRVKFLKMDGKPSTNGGTGSMLLAFGRGNAEKIRAIDGLIWSVK